MIRGVKQRIADAFCQLLLHALDNLQIRKSLKHIIRAAAYDIVRDEELRKKGWQITNLRPDTVDFHWALRPNSIDTERYLLATRESAEYVTQNMPEALSFTKSAHLLNCCLDELHMEGLILEFGVYEGTTINHIAKQTERTVHGFDSFRGLPEAWGGAPKGEFDLEGEMPEVAANVVLHAGWFDETLPEFVKTHPEPVALLHIDCDLYSSTKIVFELLKNQIISGTKIVFDEYFNYPTWRNHEYKAFQEFIQENNLQYEYIGYCNKGFSVAVRIK